MATSIEIDPARLLVLTQWLSPSYPTGGFAWSQGLESAVRDGLVSDAAGLADWLDHSLAAGAAGNDAILLALAHGRSGAALADLDDLARALCLSRERLAETLGQGAAFAAVTRAGWGFDLPDMALPVVLGRAAALAALPLTAVLPLYLQSGVTTLVLAAQRLMPLGQTAAHGVIRVLAPAIAAAARRAGTATEEDLGSAAFMADVAAMRHETLEPRIFRS